MATTDMPDTDLDRLENAIRINLTPFGRVWRALGEIRRRRLYLTTCGTWEEYLARWLPRGGGCGCKCNCASLPAVRIFTGDEQR